MDLGRFADVSAGPSAQSAVLAAWLPALRPVLSDRVDAAGAAIHHLPGAIALLPARAARHLPERYRLARALSAGDRLRFLGSVLYVSCQLTVQENAGIEPRNENCRRPFYGSRFYFRSK